MLWAVLASACAPVMRISVDEEGGDATAASHDAVLSEDGGVVVFVSAADDLVADDTNGESDVFARDLGTGTTSLLSSAPGGGSANAASSGPAISADGRHVAFVSAADDLVVGDTNGVDDVFVRDRVTGTIERVSVADDGSPLTEPSGSVSCWGVDCLEVSRGVAISDDGQWVVFVGGLSGGGGPAVLLRDRTLGETHTVLSTSFEEGADGRRYGDLALAGDGSVVAVTEEQLWAGGPPATGLRAVDPADMAATWISPPTRALAGVECCQPDVSDDGRFVAFVSPYAHTAEDDPDCGVGCGPDSDVFLLDRQSDTYTRASVSATGGELDQGARRPSVSDDGRLVSWSTTDAAVLNDQVATDQSYLRDVGAATTVRTSFGLAGPADRPVEATISGDGRMVALQSAATNLDTTDTNGLADIFVRSATVPLSTTLRAPVPAAATTTVSLRGTGLEPHTTVSVLGAGVHVEDTAWVDGSRIDVTVSVRPGALLGTRRLQLTTPSAPGLATVSECDCLEVTWSYPAPDPEPERPNVILILTDDQRWDTVDEMPATDARTDWARFDESFVHEPMCCPARATFLTGRYSHHTGVDTLLDGADLDESTTVATLLDSAGYRTGLVGRYLNGYPFGRGDYVPLGWDEFATLRGAANYFDYTLSINGTLVPFGTDEEDYITDRFAEMGREFLRETPSDEPFFLYLAPNAPHFRSGGAPPQPAPRHARACAGRSFHTPPNYNQHDTVREPVWMAGAEPVTLLSVAAHDLSTCRTLLAVDEMISSVFRELELSGRLDDTYVIVTSDNGYALGEHRLYGKGQLYEESIRVPLLVRGPDVEPGPVERLTSNVDWLPTVLDWTGVEPPPGFLDGESYREALVPGPAVGGPQAVLLHGCRTSQATGGACGAYPQEMGHNWGLRTATHKYVRYPDGDIQLFDLVADPYELSNLADDPAQAALIAELDEQLDALIAG